jgi:adenylyltransferase and sulfurtransferase
VLIVGAGGLGCPCALYLAGAGVGTLGIADGDTVAISNLHRQIAHTEAGAAAAARKTRSLAAACAGVNSRVNIMTHDAAVTPDAAVALAQQYDVVADCSDNAATRYLVSDACVAAGVPLVSGAAVATDGQLSVYNHAGGPCYRCDSPH